MASHTPQRWGLTDPISPKLPTEDDLQQNEALLTELKAQNNFEKPEDTERRVKVLSRLQQVVEEFVKHIGRMKGVAPSVLQNAGGKIFTFGSYRLGVYSPGSDIDTLVVVPKHVFREDFFEHFPSLLEKMSEPGAIEELTPVPEAFVPIIKMVYSGVDIDLIFARLHRTSILQDMTLSDTDLLRGLDESELRSVNGTRVTDELLGLVPQTKTFRQALRAVKLWAQRRGCYSAVVGFPGGVAWALMVARICQLYPYATASTIVGRFFHLIGSWPWPKPLLLKEIESGPLQVKVWNPQQYGGDKRHLMPIITPAYPSMCATHNVTHSTLRVIGRELHHANKIVQRIMERQAPWKDLFQKHTFFTQGYKYYLTVVASSRSKEAQSIWSGTVQSKVRRLVTGIENLNNDIDIAHPFNKSFDRVHRCPPDKVEEVYKGKLAYQVTGVLTDEPDDSKDIKQAVAAQGDSDLPVTNGNAGGVNDNGTVTVHTTTFYIGLELHMFDMVVAGSKSLDISEPVNDFKRVLMEWPQYDEGLYETRIVHTRNYDLPDDVFEEGEIRPTRVKKGKMNKKRSASDAETEVGCCSYLGSSNIWLIHPADGRRQGYETTTGVERNFSDHEH
ncbi:Poly(A) polymerase PAPalpha [Eremomyces bilateralis CBS 781.70]|uniref:Poly(A) polymerase n=1 Tax=Eremomyces bilateralis CBS 781.70 TaxID=1392243 RepID=A0A6G1G228_9PEZI|nr:Poly(A) polymerase PAPalpha [Eremomyces bilateralis CBS 781.70]KAF1811859.1 Poly(A) polymerase PAPalpha [Eremomyces bilateralis CBS 781.70]